MDCSFKRICVHNYGSSYYVVGTLKQDCPPWKAEGVKILAEFPNTPEGERNAIERAIEDAKENNCEIGCKNGIIKNECTSGENSQTTIR